MVQLILEEMYCIPENSVVQPHCPGTAKISLVAQAISTEMIVVKLMSKGFTTLAA